MIQLNFKSAAKRLVFGIVLYFITEISVTAQCDFNVVPGNPCPGDIVTFTVTNPQMNTTYTWDLDGDGANDDGTGSMVTFTYPFSTSAANFVVKLYSNGTVCGNAQTVSVKAAPDPKIIVTSGQSTDNPLTLISSCNSGDSVDLAIVNASTTFSSNTGYTLNWGDGSPTLSLTNASFDLSTPIHHVYFGLGYKTLTLTATNGQCSFTRTFQFFNGSNPSIGMSTLGNTVGLCAPATLTFPLANFQNNPPGTVYTFFRNTVPIATYTQATIPNSFIYIFDLTSCGETTPDGTFKDAFAVKVVATNPCGSSAATVQPVTVSSKPVPDFSRQGPVDQCPNTIYTFTNTTTNIHEYNTITNKCIDTLSANWSITPGPLNTTYQITSGSLFNSNQLKVKFLLPGTYTITMTLTPTPVCGPAVITKTITILEPPTAKADVSFSNPNGCAPLTVDFDNQSTGYQVNYTWSVSPATGWAFGGGSTANSFEPSIIFSTPDTYTVTLKAKNVCAEDIWMKTIVVKGKPLITLPDLGPFCQTATLNFTTLNTQIGANLGTISGYFWAFPGGTPSSSSSTYPTGIQYSVTSATMFNYTVTVTNECGATTATKQFEIQVPPTLTMPPDLTVCSNGTTKQLSASPTGGTWSGSGVTPSGLFDPSLAGGPGVKILTYKYGSGVCLAQGTVNVTVVAPPVVNAGADLQVCVNETNLALGGSPGGGVWTSSGSGVVVGTTFNPALSGVGIYTLTYTVTNQDGCVSSDIRVVTVKSLPVIDVSNITYCNTSGTVTLPIATPAGGTWSGPGISGNQFNPTIAGGVGIYAGTYTYTDPVTQCTNSAMITITVISPTTIDAGPDVALCQNITSFDLSAGVTPFGGTWTTTGIGVSGSVFNASIAGPGVHTITYTFGTGSCLVKDTRVITVNLLPSVNAGLDQKTCIDNTAIVLSATPVGGTWTSSGSGVITGTTFNPSASGIGAFTLTYSVTDANSCSNSDALIITVNPLPSINVGDTLYCNIPGLVQLPAANPSGGTWSGTGVSGNQFNPATAGGIGTYQAIYTYTYTPTQCKNADTIKIEVINPALVSAGIDTALCINAPDFDLNTGVTPIGGTWTSTGNGLSGSIFNPAIAGAGTYTLTYSVGAGNCLVKDTRIIKVNPLPVIVAGVDQNVCINETTLILTGTPTGGIWSSPNGGVVSTGVFNPALSGAGSFTLTYSFTDANMCANSDALNITVNPLPIIHVGDTIYCNTPGLVALPFANPGGGTWSGLGIVGNQFNPMTAGGIGTYQAIYTYTYAATQCKNADTIKIEVINPQLVNAGVDTAFCESVIIFDLSSGGTLPITGGVWTSASNGLLGTQFNPNMAGPGLHTLTYSVGTGNCLVSDTRIIEVWGLPVVSAGTDLSACVSDSSIELTPSPLGGTWVASPAAVLSGNTFKVNASGTGNYSLSYSFTDGNGCKNNDVSNLVVHGLPILTAHDTTFCNTPGLVTLPVSTPAGGNWSGTGISGLDFDPVGAGGVGVYPATYSYTDQNACKNEITVKITVIDPPMVNAGLDDTLCISNGILSLSGYLPTTGGFWSGQGIANTQSASFDPVLAGGGVHFITYTFGTGNCLVRDSAKFWVIDVPIEAGPDRTACFDDTPITLTGFNPIGGIWAGSGIINSAGVFSSTVANVGTATLHYRYTDPVLACIFTDSIQITVHPMPESDFAQPSENCINQSITFDNLSQSTYFVQWNFGDGASSTLAEPAHTYTDTGTYIITLITQNQFGCQDSVKKSIFVTEPPFAYFSTSPDSGCAVLQVAFLNNSYGYQTTYNWNFGNGQTSSLYDPGTISFQQGTKDTVYTIHISAHNLCATREWTDSVKVFPWPLANFGTTLDTICTGEKIGFNNITLGNPDTFNWGFGNGMSSTDSLPDDIQYFTDSLYKTYTIRLIATNFCGSDTTEYPVVVKPIDVRAFFNIPNKTGCEPYTVSFSNFSTPGAGISWDFGDGNTSAASNPVHTFTQPGIFKVTQKASSGCGYDSTFAYITVLPAPVVSFTSLPQICLRDSLQFSNISASLSGTIWNFGDGDTSLLYNPAHAWAQAGNYTVTLIGISSENGCPAKADASIKVLDLPKIGFAPDRPDGCVPLTIEFSNQSQGATYFEWDFGDSNTQTGSVIQHTYSAAGQYSVHLRGVDTNGCRNDSILNFITVYPLPTPSFSLHRDHLCGLPVTVTLSNNTPDAVGYSWDFGNNTGSILNNPVAVYSTSGDYNILLEATNTFGCKNNTAQSFSAYAIPISDFSVLPDTGCAPLEVSFYNQSLNSTNVLWLFSDGRQSTVFSPSMTFPVAGIYGVILIASHRDVCFDTLAFDNLITVKPSPFANFSFEEIITTPPSGEFQFTDLSIDAANWHWDFGDGRNSDDPNPTNRYYSNGEKMVTLIVTSKNGCTDDTTQTLIPRIMRGLFIPNAFTPTLSNGDASIFQPTGVGLKEYEIAVYSSYGQLLWSSDKLVGGRPAEFWNGTYKGELLPQDVYVWQVKRAVFEDGTVWEGNFDAGTGAGKKVGSVLLIR